jgi:hypothetical protein
LFLTKNISKKNHKDLDIPIFSPKTHERTKKIKTNQKRKLSIPLFIVSNIFIGENSLYKISHERTYSLKLKKINLLVIKI